MSRFFRLAIFFVLALTTLAVGDASAQRPPNIVLLLADDLGYGELGCYGQKWIKTPNIDRLAKEGMRFTDFYSGNAVCAPSRCCLMTGKHAGRAYTRDNGDPKDLRYLKEQYGWEYPGQNPIPDAEVTIAEVLKAKGYATAAIGKWGLGHFGTAGDPNKQGFDLFYGFNCQRHAHNHYPKFLWRNAVKEVLPGNDRTLYGETYSQDKFTEVALDFMKQNKEKPFFLYMPYAIPHLSIQVTDESLNEYKGKISEEVYEHKGYLKHPHPRAGYAAMISHLDRDIGKLMKQLEADGLADDTLVIFTSDNGPTYDRLGGSDSTFFNSADGLRGLKGSLYEGGIRVPMIARWPGKIAADTVSKRLGAFWDFLPTLADASGIELDSTLQNNINGQSLLPELTGKSSAEPNDLYWEFPAYGGQQALRRGKWKAIRQNMRRPNNKEPLKIELYDLVADRGESKDVSSAHPELVKELSAAMAKAHTPSDRFPFAVLDNEAKGTSIRPGINKNFLQKKLDVDEWIGKFEVESREVFAAKDAVLKVIGLKPGDKVADIGAGTGLYTRVFSKAVGDEGHVAAVDISPAFLQHLEARVREDGLKNVSVLRCREDSVGLSPSTLDFAFICDTYHHFEYPLATMRSIHRALKPGGRLVVIDFERVEGVSRDWTMGHVRAGKEVFRKEIVDAGFKFSDEVKVVGFKENYLLRFVRP